MSQRQKFRQLLSRWGLAVLALCLALIGIWLLLPTPEKQTRVIRLTAGNAAGIRHVLGQRIASEAAARNIEIVMEPTTGSAKAIEGLVSGTIDLALVQGGLSVSDRSGIRQVAALDVEPLHLLVKPHCVGKEGLPFHKLQGRKINISTPGSGTNLLALAVLRFAGFVPDVDFQPTRLSYEQLLAEDTAELPDAVFTVSMLPSPVASHLIREHSYRLIALPFATSFRLGVEKADTQNRIIRHQVREAMIPAFIYGVDPAAPEEPVETIGYQLQLLAGHKLSADDAERITALIYESSPARMGNPPFTPEGLASDGQFPLHEGTQRFLDRRAPIVSGQVVEVTEQLVAIAATAIGGVLFLWQWLRTSHRRRRDRDFLARIKRVVEIENHAAEFESDDSMSVADLVGLQAELRAMRSEIVQHFQEGRIESVELFSASLKHISDASEQLTQVILHERAPRAAVPVGTKSHSTQHLQNDGVVPSRLASYGFNGPTAGRIPVSRSRSRQFHLNRRLPGNPK